MKHQAESKCHKKSRNHILTRWDIDFFRPHLPTTTIMSSGVDSTPDGRRSSKKRPFRVEVSDDEASAAPPAPRSSGKRHRAGRRPVADVSDDEEVEVGEGVEEYADLGDLKSQFEPRAPSSSQVNGHSNDLELEGDDGRPIGFRPDYERGTDG